MTEPGGLEIDMTFKVYRRKIHCWVETEVYLEGRTYLKAYHSSTHAYPTCKAAVAALTAKYPGKVFSANFAKD